MTARKFSFVFLFVANLIIVAHAVIPHHHHDKVVCIIDSYCGNGLEAHTHLAETPDHNHDGSNNAENCSLKQLLVTPPQNIRGVSGYFVSDLDNDTYPEFVSTYESTGIIMSLLFKYISHREFTDFRSRIISWIASSHGLRAPPLA